MSRYTKKFCMDYNKYWSVPPLQRSVDQSSNQPPEFEHQLYCSHTEEVT